MSKIGRIPVPIPDGVKVDIGDDIVKVQGPLGKLEQRVRSEIEIVKEDSSILVKRRGDSKLERSLHGLYQRLISNMIIGVTRGFEKMLEIHGVGYRAKVEGKVLVLQLGFSHPVRFPIPPGITVEVKENTKISVRGIDKQLVGETAARIRRCYPPEPYKGKGIRYVGEHIRRKAGKTLGGKGGK